MRAVIQAVSSASVRVEGGEPRAIGPGIMILLGVKDTDTLDIVPKLADKCAGLRIFPDAEGKLNLSARDLGYSALVVSQFTLYGDTKKGYRPSLFFGQKCRLRFQKPPCRRRLRKKLLRFRAFADGMLQFAKTFLLCCQGFVCFL